MMRSDLICKWCKTPFRAITMPSKPRLYCSQACGHHSSKGKKHGYSGTRIHANWIDMRYRCRNPNYHSYEYYGGRGIKVCERWDDFATFLADMGPKPGKGYTIERMDNDGNYEPSNCKWATHAEQNKNRRNAYTPEEDQKIRDGVALGLNFPQLAKYVGKREKSVTARTYRLGLKSGTPPCQKITDRISPHTSAQREAPPPTWLGNEGGGP